MCWRLLGFTGLTLVLWRPVMMWICTGRLTLSGPGVLRRLRFSSLTDGPLHLVETDLLGDGWDDWASGLVEETEIYLGKVARFQEFCEGRE